MVKQSETKDKNKIEIVNFLDIDTNKITFREPKANKYNGTQIGILYNGGPMYVRYDGITPFGLIDNFDKDGNFQNTTLQINCEDKYLEKAKELDNYFINTFYEKKWGLNRNMPLSHIEGYDCHGQGGLWKRICKDSYRLNRETNEREYLNYPSKMEFTVYYKGGTALTCIYTWEGQQLDYDREKGYPVNWSLGPYHRVKFIAAWFSLTRGNFGLTLKPKLLQLKSKREFQLLDKFILDEDSDEDDDFIERLDKSKQRRELRHKERLIRFNDDTAFIEGLDPDWYNSK